MITIIDYNMGNVALIENILKIIGSEAVVFGSQSIVASIDVKRGLFGSYSVFIKAGSKDTKCDPIQYAKRAEELGVGEVLLTSIDRDGMMNGYDYELIQRVNSAVSIPVVASGGAGNLSDCVKAVNAGASAAAFE